MNTLAGLTTIYLLKWILGLHDVVANAFGYSVGLTVSLLMNSRWTFSFNGRLTEAAPRFGLVVATAYVANLTVVSLAIYWADCDSYVAQAMGVIPYSLISYFGFKHYAFRHAKHASL